MNTLLAAFAGTSTVGLVMLAWAFRHAPEGYEDEKGFHDLSNNGTTSAKPAETLGMLDELISLDKQLASQPWR